jgi:hypothetical protein
MEHNVLNSAFFMLISVGFLFGPEDGGDMFLRTVGLVMGLYAF